MLQGRESWTTCENLAKYDTLVIGGANHNMVKIHTGWPFEYVDQHTHHYTVQEYGLMVADTMRLVTNRPDCAVPPSLRIIWVGTPAIPPQEKQRKDVSTPPQEADWYEGRSTQRMALFSKAAEEAARKAGASIIDMLAISQPLAADMTWNHMDVVDSLCARLDGRTDSDRIALAREMHDKIRPDLPAGQ